MMRKAGAIVILVAAACFASPAPAQETLAARQAIQQLSIDDLFARLRVSPEPRSAEALEREIVSRFHRSGSDTVDLLFSWALDAIQKEETALAFDVLDQIIVLKPDFPEAWNKRATLAFVQKDYGAALGDLRHVLSLEPRHFGALSGLGLVLEEIGEDEQALRVFREALAIHPHLKNITEMVQRLERGEEAREI